MKAKVQKLGWSGMEEVEIEVKNFPKKALEVDDWFKPYVGELCLNDNHELDVVKSVYWKKPSEMFKGSVMYEFENSNIKMSSNNVFRVQVKPGKTFIFNDKLFVHREATDGGYIKQLALNGKVEKYEYEKFE